MKIENKYTLYEYVYTGLSDYLSPTELVGEEEELCVSEKGEWFPLHLTMLIHNER